MDVQITLTLALKSCPECGVLFGLTDQYVFVRPVAFCPNGHQVQVGVVDARQTLQTIEPRAIAAPVEEVEPEAPRPTRYSDCPYCGSKGTYGTGFSGELGIKTHIRMKHPERYAEFLGVAPEREPEALGTLQEIADRQEEPQVGRPRALSSQQEEDIRDRYAANRANGWKITRNELASEYGVSKGTIDRVLGEDEGRNGHESPLASAHPITGSSTTRPS